MDLAIQVHYAINVNLIFMCGHKLCTDPTILGLSCITGGFDFVA